MNRVVQHPVQAFAAALAAVGILSVMDAVMTALVLALGIYVISVWRSVVNLILTGGLYLPRRLPWPNRSILKIHVGRGIIVALMAFLFFWGIGRVPLAQAIALNDIKLQLGNLVYLGFVRETPGEWLKELREEMTARAAKQAGATRFCMGAAWRAPKDRDIEKVVELVRVVKAEGLEACCTLGMLTDAQAQSLKQAIQRPFDSLARYGGEEFACLLPMTDLAGATAIAQSMQVVVVGTASRRARSIRRSQTLQMP